MRYPQGQGGSQQAVAASRRGTTVSVEFRGKEQGPKEQAS
jgi:hypothetical protein